MSWNPTCGLTQLVIETGERVVLFVIRANPKNNIHFSGLGSTIYHPVGAPFYGVYDELGLITPDKDREKYHLSVIKTLGATETDVDVFLRNLVHHKISVDGSGTPGGLAFSRMLVKQTALDVALKHVGSYPRCFDDDTTYREECTDALTTARDALKKNFDTHGNNHSGYLMSSIDIKDRLRTILGIPSAINYMNYLFPPNTHPDMVAGLVDVILLGVALDGLRKSWSPQVGARNIMTDTGLTDLLCHYSLEETRRLCQPKHDDEVESDWIPTTAQALAW